MKKVVRLTENDLARIVKRVIKESTKPTFPIFIKLLPIKNEEERWMFFKEYTNLDYIADASSPILVNVVSKNQGTSSGCVFDFYVKGSTKRGNFEIQCFESRYSQIKVPFKSYAGDRTKELFKNYRGDTRYLLYNISQTAMTKLRTACGCQAYVSNQNKDTEQPGGNSYV